MKKYKTTNYKKSHKASNTEFVTIINTETGEYIDTVQTKTETYKPTDMNFIKIFPESEFYTIGDNCELLKNHFINHMNSQNQVINCDFETVHEELGISRYKYYDFIKKAKACDFLRTKTKRYTGFYFINPLACCKCKYDKRIALRALYITFDSSSISNFEEGYHNSKSLNPQRTKKK